MTVCAGVLCDESCTSSFKNICREHPSDNTCTAFCTEHFGRNCAAKCVTKFGGLFSVNVFYHLKYVHKNKEYLFSFSLLLFFFKCLLLINFLPFKQ